MRVKGGYVCHRILAVRSALLGPAAAPLAVIGPRPLRRVLAAVSQLEPMAFRYIDTCNTLPPPPNEVRPCLATLPTPHAVIDRWHPPRITLRASKFVNGSACH